MKSSLKKAIDLFNFVEQIRIYRILICFKLGWQLKARSGKLWASVNQLVRLIEKGIIFKKNKLFFDARLTIGGKDVEVYLRKYSSDLQVFESVLVNGEYHEAVPLLQAARNLQDKCIIDAGGNIGLTTVYLHCFFPHVKFIIIEPDEQNFHLLQKNLQLNQVTNVSVLQNALWTKAEKLIMDNDFRDGQNWSLTVKQAETETDAGFVEGVTLDQLCMGESFQKIALLKIDIEGAERFLFRDNAFLATVEKHVECLIIEIHDEFNIRETIHASMQTMGFESLARGAVAVYYR